MSGSAGSLNIGSILSPEDVRTSLEGKHICPFCGNVNESSEGACPRCRMEDTPATRKATKARIGPWHVRQSRNPSAPGMKFDTLMMLVQKGQVTPGSIVRGPTTQQLWRFAAKVKGLSREFGICYACGEGISLAGTNICRHCNRLQLPPLDADMLLEMEEIPFNQDRPIERPVRRPPPPAPVAAVEPEPESFTTELARFERTHGPPRRPAEENRDNRRPTPQPAPTPEPPPQRAPRPEAKILSPQDLAAAFRIGLKPDANRKAPKSAAAARVSHPFRNFVLTVLMLAIIGGGVLLYLRPDLREVTTNWTNKQIESIKQFAMAKPAPPPVPHGPFNQQSIDFPEATQSSHTDLPANKISVVPPVPQLVRTEPPPVIEVKPIVTPTEAPATQTAPPAVVQIKKDLDVPPTPMELSSAIDHAKSLWYTAIDAEQHRDYATAAKLYLQIKQLPEASWPKGLDLRLARVQKQLSD